MKRRRIRWWYVLKHNQHPQPQDITIKSRSCWDVTCKLRSSKIHTTLLWFASSSIGGEATQNKGKVDKLWSKCHTASLNHEHAVMCYMYLVHLYEWKTCLLFNNQFFINSFTYSGFHWPTCGGLDLFSLEGYLTELGVMLGSRDQIISDWAFTLLTQPLTIISATPNHSEGSVYTTLWRAGNGVLCFSTHSHAHCPVLWLLWLLLRWRRLLIKCWQEKSSMVDSTRIESSLIAIRGKRYTDINIS